uniref:Uncharacterized protein n=1 Tax=Oryza punctata TaxID=4537 RepID=A0A0E0KR18_ORYPU
MKMTPAEVHSDGALEAATSRRLLLAKSGRFRRVQGNNRDGNQKSTLQPELEISMERSRSIPIRAQVSSLRFHRIASNMIHRSQCYPPGGNPKGGKRRKAQVRREAGEKNLGVEILRRGSALPAPRRGGGEERRRAWRSLGKKRETINSNMLSLYNKPALHISQVKSHCAIRCTESEEEVHVQP